jgi:hypothetical protein
MNEAKIQSIIQDECKKSVVSNNPDMSEMLISWRGVL